jgi:hypothetical protein
MLRVNEKAVINTVVRNKFAQAVSCLVRFLSGTPTVLSYLKIFMSRSNELSVCLSETTTTSFHFVLNLLFDSYPNLQTYINYVVDRVVK